MRLNFNQTDIINQNENTVETEFNKIDNELNKFIFDFNQYLQARIVLGQSKCSANSK